MSDLEESDSSFSHTLPDNPCVSLNLPFLPDSEKFGYLGRSLSGPGLSVIPGNVVVSSPKNVVTSDSAHFCLYS